MAFHDIRFPLAISRRASGGPRRRTQIVALASGHEERNQQWADSRRHYNAGIGLRSVADIHTLIDFFEARRGRMHGFLWRDIADFKSCGPAETITATDQAIGTGDGIALEYPLIKTYGQPYAPYDRPIEKPVDGSVVIAFDGVPHSAGFTVDHSSGLITFSVPPASGVVISAGFEFDVPVRFDTDTLEIDFAGFEAGAVPDIPIIEIRGA